MWHIHTIKYYSAIKKNVWSTHKKTWMNLIRILLSERSKSEKAAHSMLPIIWHFSKSKTIAIVEISVDASSSGRKGKG